MAPPAALEMEPPEVELVGIESFTAGFFLSLFVAFPSLFACFLHFPFPLSFSAFDTWQFFDLQSELCLHDAPFFSLFFVLPLFFAWFFLPPPKVSRG